jgi:hypothetical protein
MYRVVPFFLIMAVCILASAGCSQDRRDTSSPLSPSTVNLKAGTGAVALTFLFPSVGGQSAGKIAAAESIDKVTAYVLDTDAHLVFSQNLTMSGGYADGFLSIAAPDTVVIYVVFFDGPTVRWTGRSPSIIIVGGTTTPASLSLQFTGVSVTASASTVPADSAYHVDWVNPNTFTQSYDVQESTDINFASATGSWNTPNQGLTLATGKETTGTYYYRARIQTMYGPGAWYSRGTAAVQVVQNNGGVNIHVPLPGDEP